MTSPFSPHVVDPGNPGPLEAALDGFSELAAHRLGVDGVEIQLEDAGGFWRRAAQGPRGWMPTCCLAFGQPLPEGRDLVELLEPSRDPRFSHWSREPSGPEFKFFAATPLLDRTGRRLGALCVTSLTERAALSDDERQLVLDLARRCARELQTRRELVDRRFPAPRQARPVRAKRLAPPPMPVWTTEEWIADRLAMSA
jgi:GAF domain-containing protein